MKKNSENIMRYEDEYEIHAKNLSGRVIFRFSKIDGSFAAFRSHRMTDEEKEYCIQQFRSLTDHRNLMTEERLIAALNYRLDEDIYCS